MPPASTAGTTTERQALKRKAVEAQEVGELARADSVRNTGVGIEYTSNPPDQLSPVAPTFGWREVSRHARSLAPAPGKAILMEGRSSVIGSMAIKTPPSGERR